MNRLTLFKSASDFAFANVDVKDPVELTQAQVTAFKTANLDSRDFAAWSQYATQSRNQFSQLAGQLTPSALEDNAKAQTQAQAPKVIASNAAAATAQPEQSSQP